jgi:hypothetical protein
VIVYLASPKTQQQAEHACDMPVLISYALWRPWMADYAVTFGRILVDSGAFSEMNSGETVDIDAYREWAAPWLEQVEAIAGLDDISGDWRRSMANYDRFPESFPTFHDTDPPELLDELIPMARERSRWLGIGLMPPRHQKERFVRTTLDRIPDDLHVHGWALRQYTHLRRLDSVDSTNWFRDAMDLCVQADLQHLTYGECLEIVVKRYKRWTRRLRDDSQTDLFDH